MDAASTHIVDDARWPAATEDDYRIGIVTRVRSATLLVVLTAVLGAVMATVVGLGLLAFVLFLVEALR